jgi:hypothetical protein
VALGILDNRSCNIGLGSNNPPMSLGRDRIAIEGYGVGALKKGSCLSKSSRGRRDLRKGYLSVPVKYACGIVIYLFFFFFLYLYAGFG